VFSQNREVRSDVSLAAHVANQKDARQGGHDPTGEPLQRGLRVIADVTRQQRKLDHNAAEQRLGNDLVRHFECIEDAENILRGGFADVYERSIEAERKRPGAGLSYFLGACARSGEQCA